MHTASTHYERISEPHFAKVLITYTQYMTQTEKAYTMSLKM